MGNSFAVVPQTTERSDFKVPEAVHQWSGVAWAA